MSSKHKGQAWTRRVSRGGVMGGIGSCSAAAQRLVTSGDLQNPPRRPEGVETFFGMRKQVQLLSSFSLAMFALEWLAFSTLLERS